MTNGTPECKHCRHSGLSPDLHRLICTLDPHQEAVGPKTALTCLLFERRKSDE